MLLVCLRFYLDFDGLGLTLRKLGGGVLAS